MPSRKINDGSIGFQCPQAFPGWAMAAFSTIRDPDDGGIDAVSNNPPQSEDCLFLDVIVPRKVFRSSTRGGAKAPVLVWLYGGGYVSGMSVSSWG